MPTFFGRRYMRGRPPRKERLMGVALLAFLAVIVLVCLATTGYLGDGILQSGPVAQAKTILGAPTQPLFEADPKNFKPPPPPHEMRIAQSLLPQSIDTWQQSKPTAQSLLTVQAATQQESSAKQETAGAELVNSLTASARSFGARWLYGASYTPPQAKPPCVLVSIVDAVEPSAAFGLWRAREPKGALEVSVGRGGWMSNDKLRLGFWAGRYYTEVENRWCVEHGGVVEMIARGLAGVQLVYGGPFWADAVLPMEQRVEHSFRYVREKPLGLDVLSDCWLADYPDDLTLGVMQPPAQQRSRILDELGQRRAASPSENNEGYDEHSGGEYGSPAAQPDSEDMPADAVVGKMDDRTWVAFPAGEYLFVASAPQAATLSRAAQTLAQRWSRQASAASIASQPPGDTASTGQARFADLGDAAIQTPIKIERYTDNLYEKINGREPQFRAYHFVELRWAQYLDTQRQRAFDVYIYDMGEPVNAFGMYMKERSGEVRDVNIGRGGYASGSSTFFWKGRYYVGILGPPENDDADVRVSQRIAAGIAETIADDGQAFWAESLLPTQDRKPDTFTYQATSVLGFNFLERAFMATYQTQGNDYQLFILKADDAASAQKLFDQYADNTAKYDQVVSREAAGEGCRMVSESLKVYAVVFCQGNYLGGVIECADQALATQAAESFRNSLP